MADYFLTVYKPIPDPANAPTGAVLLGTVLRVTVENSLAWVKKHADEIARKYSDGARYCALWVSDADTFCAERVGA